MAFAEISATAAQRFADAARAQEAPFQNELGKLTTDFSQKGSAVDATCIESMALLHSNHFKKLAETALKSIMDAMNTAKEPLSAQNIAEVRAFLHNTLNQVYNSLRASGPVENVLSQLPQYQGIWKKQLSGTLMHEKVRLDAKLELLLKQ